MLDLSSLYALQSDLDAKIASLHNVSYESTKNRRLMALIVEISELANASRCFKYWSNKGSESLERIKDEYADGLHFLLSLGIPLKTNIYTYNIKKSDLGLTEQFLNLFKAALALSEHYDLDHYQKCMELFLSLAPSLKMSEEDIISSYKNKLEVNYQRQENNY